MQDIKKIGRYDIVNTIGSGGFATVYLGHDPYINRAVAIKVSESKIPVGKNPALARLFQEAAAAGSLVHPNIVTIFDAGIEGALCYIAMEYVEGASLNQNCVERNLLPIADAIDVMIKVCHGIDYAHQRGIIHRDIKPGNILVSTIGEIKIADFGLASFAEIASHDHRRVGTPSYMPPEQVEGRGSTPQSDIFSAGVVLYRLLSGAKPFEGANADEICHKIIEEPHVPLKERNPDLPPELFEITDRALAKKPEDRYRSGFEFARDLEAVLHGSKKPLGGRLAGQIKHLRTLHFFEDFTEEEIARLLSIGAWLTHREGEVIVSEEERCTGFFTIAAGEVQVMVGGKVVRRLGRGDCFGEVSFLLNRRRTATIVAALDSNLLRLNAEKISILDKDTQIKLYRLFAKTLAGYLLKDEGKGLANR